MEEEIISSTSAMLKDHEIIHGAMSFVWDEGIEIILRELFLKRKLIAMKMMDVRYNSEDGKTLLEIIKIINQDIEKVLSLYVFITLKINCKSY